MDALFYSQVDFILKRASGIKTCLFDGETKSMVGTLIPLSLFNDNGYFHFDLLSNKNRSRIEGMSCVTILRPESISLLLEELVTPFYSNYIVLLTSQVDPLVLELMANADIYSLITEVHEINLDLCKQAPYLYTTKSEQYKRNVDGLCSAILSLEINPEILIFNDDNKNNEDAKSIKDMVQDIQNRTAQYSFANKGTLVLLDRSFDLISPLIQSWSYHSLINDYLETEDGLVILKGKKYKLNDDFSLSNMSNEIVTVGEAIKILVKEVEKSKERLTDSIDIQSILENKAIAEIHVQLYKEIANNAIEKQKLQDFSEAQFKILDSSEINIAKLFDQYTEKQYLNLLLLYFLRHVKNWQETSKLFPKYRSQLLEFYEKYKPRSFWYKYSLNKEVDPKLAYVPAIKRIIKHIVNNKIKDGTFIRYNGNDVQKKEIGPVIVYIEGGVTILEYRELMNYAKLQNIEIFVIGTDVLNVHSFTKYSEVQD